MAMHAKIIEDFFSDKEAQMLNMLEHIVNLCSFTGDREGVEKVGRYLMDFLSAHGFYTKQIEKTEIPENGSIRIVIRLLQNPIPLIRRRELFLRDILIRFFPVHIAGSAGLGLILKRIGLTVPESRI